MYVSSYFCGSTVVDGGEDDKIMKYDFDSPKKDEAVN
jgi:hypothetical protein